MRDKGKWKTDKKETDLLGTQEMDFRTYSKLKVRTYIFNGNYIRDLNIGARNQNGTQKQCT